MTYLSLAPIESSSRRLEGKVVFVTGAASGIGAAATSLFAREGAHVVAASRRADRLEQLTGELRAAGHAAESQPCDVRDEDSVRAAIEGVIERHGRLDGAFNNAGVGGAQRRLHELSADRFDAVIGTNLRGVFLCMKHEIAAMLSNGGGAIVNTSSIGGLVGGPRNSDYGASKWGLAGLTKCAAMDYARDGIRVNAIAPGPTRSEMFDRWLPTEEARAAMAAHAPMNYIAHPEDMARAALFLLSEESRWTTGVVFPCDGGSSVD